MNSPQPPTTPDRGLPPGAQVGEARSAMADAVSPELPVTTGIRLDLYDNSDFDRGAGRLKEALWVLVKCAFFLPHFPWPSSLRVQLLRLFGARIGRDVVIRSGVNITFPWRFSTGDHVWIGDEALILSLAEVRLGSHVCLSQRTFLCTGSHEWRRETFDLQTRPIVVEDSVWICAQAFVGPGVCIGSHSVVGAGAVVTKSAPENSVVQGNPAIVRPRF